MRTVPVESWRDEGVSPGRILLFSPSAPNAVGGMETVYEQLAAYLRNAGHDVTTLYGGIAARRVGEAAWVVPLEVLRTRHRIPLPRSAARVVCSFWSVLRLLVRLKPTSVHIHFVGAEALYFLSVRRFFGYRVVVTAHGSDIRHHYNPVSRLVQPYVLRKADAVTAVSASLAEIVRERSGRDAHVVLNGVDLDFWRRPQPKEHLSGAPTVVSVGRLERVKGTDVLIRAFSTVVQQFPQARLEVIGEGSLRPEIERLIRDLGLDRHVVLRGAMPPQSIRARLHQADVLAMPSRNEAFGLAALEGMAAGLPVVASETGGLPDLVGEAGVLVPPDNPIALANALVSVLSDEPLRQRMVNAAARRAKLFSWERSALAYEAILTAE